MTELYQTKRPTNSAAEELLGKYFPVFNDDASFVALWDYMGTDKCIEESARVSYSGGGTRKVNKTRGLLRYLKRNNHCYRADMEVLTSNGWKRWDVLNKTEEFLIPDPKTRSFKKETLEVLNFDNDSELECFYNERMSYAVTANHRMWFKGKYRKEFEIFEADKMFHWGHFDPLRGYKLTNFEGDKDPKMQFLGFCLGDGHYINNSSVTFHLKKQRKINYLNYLIDKLQLKCRVSQSSTYEDALYFYVQAPWIYDYLSKDKSKYKKYLKNLSELNNSEIRGLYDGLKTSDGSVKADRDQIEFSSDSADLVSLFQALSAFMGVDAHFAHNPKINSVKSYYGDATTLEARKHCFLKKHYKGKVYCTTSSTGLLMVRGGPDKFAFVCGNSSPSEMMEVKFHCSMPIFIARQTIRHRTFNINEVSGRYSLLPMLFYTPPEEQFKSQSKNNNQGRGEQLDSIRYQAAVEAWNKNREYNKKLYEDLASDDVAREIARIDLPLSTYTQWIWKVDLHNLQHFLKLRVDPHAQWEVRQFANIIAGMYQKIAPLSYEAWVDYQLSAKTFSKQELKILTDALAVTQFDDHLVLSSKMEDLVVTDKDIPKRELSELFAKLQPPIDYDFSLDLSQAKDFDYFKTKFEAATPKIDKDKHD